MILIFFLIFFPARRPSSGCSPALTLGTETATHIRIKTVEEVTEKFRGVTETASHIRMKTVERGTEMP